MIGAGFGCLPADRLPADRLAADQEFLVADLKLRGAGSKVQIHAVYIGYWGKRALLCWACL